MNATLVCAALVVAVSSCSGLSAVERRLAGKWESTERQEDGSTTTEEIRFTADGTYSWGFPSKPRVLTGRWCIEGHDLVITVETQAPDSRRSRRSYGTTWCESRSTSLSLGMARAKENGRDDAKFI